MTLKKQVEGINGQALHMTSSSAFQIGLYSKHYYAFKQLGMRGCYIVNVVTATGHMTQTQSNARNLFICENIHSKEQTPMPYSFKTSK